MGAKTHTDGVDIGFIGAGNMAFAIVGGLIRAGWPPGTITVTDPNPGALSRYRQLAVGIRTSQNNDDAVLGAEALVMAVKPQVFVDVAEQLDQLKIAPDCVVISVAAGITLDTMNQVFPDQPLVRCMPNQGALVGHGATGLHANGECSGAQRDLAERILASTGTSVWLDNESLIDVVTAVSGSGPAYFYLLIEALTESAVARGLTREQAVQLVNATALGASTLADSGDTDAADLRARVTSPGGTTAAGIEALVQNGFREAVDAAVAAALARSVELAKN
ncbi:MAG: pyrroline-5-carboxylate reductase [Pseudomonadota bacterium]